MRNKYLSIHNYEIDYFNYSLLWNIDFKCNGNCIYCDHAKIKETITNEDRIQKSIKNIIKENPKILIITGGEPTQNDNLPDYIEEIKKECPEIKIVLISNLIEYEEDKWNGLLNHLNSIMISIDGKGDVNSRNRKTNGDLILNNLKSLVKQAREKNAFIMTNTVINSNSYDNICELIESINAISDEIIILLSAQTPKDNPLSIFGDKPKINKLLINVEELKEKYGSRRIYLNGFESRSIVCHAQKFQKYILPDGSINYCQDKKFTGSFSGKNFLNHVKNNLLKDSNNIFSYLISSIKGEYSHVCFNHCNNLYFMNEIMGYDESYKDFIIEPLKNIKTTISAALLSLYYCIIFLFDDIFTDDSVKYAKNLMCSKSFNDIYHKFPLDKYLRSGFNLNDIQINIEKEEETKMFVNTEWKNRKYMSKTENENISLPIMMERDKGLWKVNAEETFSRWHTS